MFAALLRLFGFSLIGISLFVLSLVFIFLALLIRFLPRSFPFIRQGLRIFLILSYRFYKLSLIRIAPSIDRVCGLDILDGHWKLIVCTLLSLIFGLSIHLVTRTHVNVLLMGLAGLHGLSVALIWDELENPAGIHLGERIL